MEQVMEDCTIIIQGKLEQDSYDFYVEKLISQTFQKILV